MPLLVNCLHRSQAEFNFAETALSIGFLYRLWNIKSIMMHSWNVMSFNTSQYHQTKSTQRHTHLSSLISPCWNCVRVICKQRILLGNFSTRHETFKNQNAHHDDKNTASSPRFPFRRPSFFMPFGSWNIPAHFFLTSTYFLAFSFLKDS